MLENVQNIITAFAGTGTYGSSGDGGAATSAQFANPLGVSADIHGNVFIADNMNNKIRMVNSAGIITTIAGTGFGAPYNGGSSGDGGAATSAQLYFPSGVSADVHGNLYIADCNNHKIRMVNSTGIITTFAGTGVAGSSGDGGKATSAQLYAPTAVSADIHGNVYFSDYYKIRMVNSTGIITTIAGTGTWGSSGDGGRATSAQLNYPQGVSADTHGNVFIADAWNNKIRMVNSVGIITTIAGTETWGASGDGGAATLAQLNSPWGVSADTHGNVFIADAGNNKIRMVFQPQLPASPTLAPIPQVQ